MYWLVSYLKDNKHDKSVYFSDSFPHEKRTLGPGVKVVQVLRSGKRHKKPGDSRLLWPFGGEVTTTVHNSKGNSGDRLSSYNTWFQHTLFPDSTSVGTSRRRRSHAHPGVSKDTGTFGQVDSTGSGPFS